MSTLHELAQRLMALDDRITSCMKCGLCQAVCPMFGASGMEADVARGKLALIDGLAHELLKSPCTGAPRRMAKLNSPGLASRVRKIIFLTGCRPMNS